MIYRMEVNGTTLPYVVAGQGPTIVFVHGALADYRLWASHQAALADSYRTIAYTQRYFGTDPWDSSWPPFGITTHAADLGEFIRKLDAGPVHVVGWSYAGHIALDVALKQPELVLSVFIYEPGLPTCVTDPAELDLFGADAALMFGPVFEAVQGKGDNNEGVRRLIDGSGQQNGYFQAQSPERKKVQLDNARTLPMQLAQAPPPPINCELLGTLIPPVCIAYGERTRPVFSVVSQAAARCIPQGRHKVIAGAGHMWPDEEPANFVAAVVDFLKG